MKPIKTLVSVFLFSVPMGLTELWLEKNTKLVKFSKNWNSFYTISFLSVTFWIVRAFIALIRLLDKKRGTY